MHGFSKGISADVPIGKYLDHVIKGINDNQYRIGVVLDLQKAFDMVDHTILMLKLNHYAIRGPRWNFLRRNLPVTEY